MSIIDYTLDKGNIDFIVTGDSKQELEYYTGWINQIFSFINKKNMDIKQGNYNTASFFRDFIKLQNYFKNYLGIGNKKIDNSKKIIKYPVLFNIHENIDFSISSFGDLLREGLGFSFHGDSFNFSETDCFYPAVMALMAYLRGGNDYLNYHVEHVIEIMEEKDFPNELIDEARYHYNQDISNAKQHDIKQFLLNKIGIDEKKLKSLIYSPFLDNGNRLQHFLNKNNINLKSISIIKYIKKGNTSIFNPITKLITSNGDEEKKIETFINEWIGLPCEDIRKIMNYSSEPRDTKLLEVIAKNDPYVKNIDIGNGETITISGR